MAINLDQPVLDGNRSDRWNLLPTVPLSMVRKWNSNLKIMNMLTCIGVDPLRNAAFCCALLLQLSPCRDPEGVVVVFVPLDTSGTSDATLEQLAKTNLPCTHRDSL